MIDNQFKSTLLEKTCRCMISAQVECNNGQVLDFWKGREYQVDIFVYPEFDEMYKVYQNGGYDHFVLQTPEEFNNIFQLIN